MTTTDHAEALEPHAEPAASSGVSWMSAFGELNKKFGPAVDWTMQAAGKGAGATSAVASQVRESVTHEQSWQRQEKLVAEIVEVLAMQQAAIEQLRARVAELESTA